MNRFMPSPNVANRCSICGRKLSEKERKVSYICQKCENIIGFKKYPWDR